MSERINVTKSFLPPFDEYESYLKKIWENDWLTNQGPLLDEFESKIKDRFKVKNFQFVTNGTLALQVAIKALGIDDGEIITTPFSYVATTSSILWQGVKPVFVDIDPDSFCIDANKIEAAITPRTKAILAVHVFGNVCDIEAIELIAKKHGLKVIYDGAHAFDVFYKGKSVFSYGDISICSFHATKLFHTIEGGGLFMRDDDIAQKVEVIKHFGHNFDEYISLGINAKASEFQAAMGLSNLKYINEIVSDRKRVIDRYDLHLHGKFQLLKLADGVKYNNSYYPVVFPSEEEMLRVREKLNEQNIMPRRYFFPSLNTLSYLETSNKCPISEDISSRILCLPLYVGLENETVDNICRLMTS